MMSKTNFYVYSANSQKLKCNNTLCVFLLILIGLLHTFSGFAQHEKTVKYIIKNESIAKSISLIQLQSEDKSFNSFDTVSIVNNVDNGSLFIKYNIFKPYKKIIVNSNLYQYSSPITINNNLCIGYIVRITDNGLIITETNYFQVRTKVIQVVVFFFITFFVKLIPIFFLKIKYSQIKISIIVHTILIILIFFLFTYKYLYINISFIYYTALISMLLESIWYYIKNKKININLLSNKVSLSIISNILWVGITLTLLFLQFFSEC